MKMVWFPAVLTALLLTNTDLGVWITNPVDQLQFSSSQMQLKEGEKEEDKSLCFPTLFSFGSSIADTGTQAIAFSFQPTEFPPYGSTFFGKPANRYSDGRIHIDFWATALKIPFLDPYLKSLGSNFRRGVNFAASGATATNTTRFSAISLSIQLNQFREFKRDVLDLITRGSGSSSQNRNDYHKLPLEHDFGDALYIVAIGGNDIVGWTITDNRPLEEVELLVPQVSNEIVRVVEALYAEGARNILVEDVFPQGCIPYFLQHFSTRNQFPDGLDAAGCFKPVNDLVQLHNSLLKKGIAELGKRLPNASISLVDTFRIRYGIVANHDQYGFTEPTKSCCGAGGEYNYRPDCHCGQFTIDDGVLITAGMCDNVSSHAVWDHLHYTDAFNRATMKGILTGQYFEPGFDLIRNGCVLGEI